MNSPLARARRWTTRRLALAVLVLTAGGLLAARPSLQSVRVVGGDGVTSVVLSADGALPAPKVGVLADPPRIYLDFPDVTTVTEGARVDGDGLVRGVRVRERAGTADEAVRAPWWSGAWESPTTWGWGRHQRVAFSVE